AGVAGDQQDAVVAAAAPGVDGAEEPLPAAEVAAFLLEEGGEVPGAEAVVPGAVAGRLVAEGGFEAVQQPGQALVVALLGLPPGVQIDVVEAEDAEGRLAGAGHDGDDALGRVGEAGEADLVEADAVQAVGVFRVVADAD